MLVLITRITKRASMRARTYAFVPDREDHQAGFLPAKTYAFVPDRKDHKAGVLPALLNLLRSA